VKGLPRSNGTGAVPLRRPTVMIEKLHPRAGIRSPEHQDNVHVSRPVVMMCRLHEGGDRGPLCSCGRIDATVEIGMVMARDRRAMAGDRQKTLGITAEEPVTVRIGLLGGFRVSVGARTIEKDAWRLRKAASLVKLLALAPGHRLHRERVMDTLWPELGRKAASNNLRGALHAARRAVEPDQGPRYLELQGEQLVLCPGARLQVDVDAFEEAASSARRFRDPVARRTAINLYAGELLPEDRYEGWTESRREALRQLYLALLAAPAIPHDKSTAPSTGGPSEESEGSPRHNLPALRAGFVGRERELVEARKVLSVTRHLTFTGAGGSGKTRLAVELARGLIGLYPDGVWLVELAGLSEPDLVVQTLASTLEVREQPGLPLLDAIIGALRDKEILLVVDNCEHLIDAAARLVEALLRSCPRLVVLATSREPLGTSGEAVWQVGPLSVPDASGGSTAEDLMRYEAVRLFVERARSALPGFELTGENAGAVARVCRKLEGIPLAIELATARMGPLAVEQVAQRLEDSLDVLSSAGQGAAPRQQTLRATLDWSHKLLSEAEQTLFKRLSVFAGGWTLEAAETVGSGGGVEESDVLDLLGELVDKSLVVAGASTGSAVRYRMLEPIRQYAREKLEQGEDVDEVKTVHVAYFLQLAEEAEPELDGPQQRLWVERLEGEHDNLRETLSWALESEESELALRLGAALWRFWFARRYHSEGTKWLDQILACTDSTASPTRVKVIEGTGLLAQRQGDVQRAEVIYQEMLELSLALGDKGNAATALNSLGTLAVTRGDNERARALLEENLAVLRELHDEPNAATTLKRYHALNLLGILAINEEGDLVRGAALWEESLTLAREAGDIIEVGSTLTNLGYAALLQRDNERAATFSQEALAVARDLGSAGGEIIPEALINLGLAARAQGSYERAKISFEDALLMSQQAGVKASVINALEGMVGLAGALREDIRTALLWGAAEAAREINGIALPPSERTLHEPYLASARSRLGEVAWRDALAEGRAMSLEGAAEYALSEEETDSPVPSVPEHPSVVEPTGDLTRREREVAILVAKGLTNREISSKHSISERTAGNHVASILGKHGLHSRVQIATWATERQLLSPEHN
jgi:predicted ATPase/DNA-binding CsgD family transcriptional regulator